MTSTRAVAYIGGVSLLLAWLASASGGTRQPQRGREPSRAGDAAVLQTIASDVQSQASRLRKRLATAPSPQGTVRNPFTFAARAPQATRRTPPPAAPSPVEALESERVPVEPVLSLLGVAEEKTATGAVRTAIIAGRDDELIMAKVGQTIGGRYLVVAVAPDAVELKDTATGLTRRLVLR